MEDQRVGNVIEKIHSFLFLGGLGVQKRAEREKREREYLKIAFKTKANRLGFGLLLMRGDRIVGRV